MLILETLSTNRNLEDKIKEVEDMLRTVKMEDLPNYQRVLERGVDIAYTNAIIKEKDNWVSQGLSQGLSQGMFETAIVMIKDFNIAIDDVVEKLNIKKEELLEYMKKKNN